MYIDITEEGTHNGETPTSLGMTSSPLSYNPNHG